MGEWEEGYGSGMMGGDFGYGAGKGTHGMGGYGGARHGMGGGYRGGSEGSIGGLRGGYGSEFGSGVPDCLDELPSDYSDSVCYKQWDETSCEKIAIALVFLETFKQARQVLKAENCRRTRAAT